MVISDPDYPHNPNPFFKKGLAALEKKNFAYAVELFLEVLKFQPDFTECYRYIWTAARSARPRQSLSLIQKTADVLNALALRTRAVFWQLRGDIDRAVGTQLRATVRIPDNISAIHELAILFLRQPNPAAAQLAFEEVLRLNPNNVAALRHLCRLYFDAKHYPQAKTAANRLLRIKTHDLEAETTLKNIAALGMIEGGFDNIRPVE